MGANGSIYEEEERTIKVMTGIRLTENVRNRMRGASAAASAQSPPTISVPSHFAQTTAPSPSLSTPGEPPPPSVEPAPLSPPPSPVESATPSSLPSSMEPAPSPLAPSVESAPPSPSPSSVEPTSLPPSVEPAQTSPSVEPAPPPPPYVEPVPHSPHLQSVGHAPSPLCVKTAPSSPSLSVESVSSAPPPPSVEHPPSTSPPLSVEHAPSTSPPLSVEHAPSSSPPPSVEHAPSSSPPPSVEHAPSSSPPLSVEHAPPTSPPLSVEHAPSSSPPLSVEHAPPLHMETACTAPVEGVSPASSRVVSEEGLCSTITQEQELQKGPEQHTSLTEPEVHQRTEQEKMQMPVGERFEEEIDCAATQDHQLRAHLYAHQLEQRYRELKKQDALYREQVAKLEWRGKRFYSAISESYQKASQEVRAKFRQYQINPVCADLQREILKCYRENSGQTLSCSRIASLYLRCVSEARQSKTRQGD